MATITIPRLVGKTNRAGLTTWYWQPSKTVRARGYEPLRLGAAHALEPPQHVIDACKARNAEVDNALAGGLAAAPRPVRVRTVGQLIDLYVEAGYPSVKHPGKFVAAATRKQYEWKFKIIRAWAGDIAIGSITPERVGRLRDEMMKPVAKGRWAGTVRHAGTHETLRVGSALFKFAEQKGLIARGANPFKEFGLAAPDPRDNVWSAPALEAVMAAADKDGDESMALAIDLAYRIGQREADLLRNRINQYAEIPAYKMDPEVFDQLSRVPVPAFAGRPGYIPGDVKGIRLRQNKTKVWLEVPVVGLTRARIEAAIEKAKEGERITLLYNMETSLPWTHPNERTGQEYFIRRFAALRAAAIAAAREAGDAALAEELGALQYRDFRRSAVVSMGELGIADHLIAAITLHSLDRTKKILETYLPRTTGQAARAIALSQARAAPAEAKEQQG